MQGWFGAWLAWPVYAVFASLFAVYFCSVGFIAWLCWRSPLRAHLQSYKGVAAPFFMSTAVIFGFLVAFLSNDIWDRNKQAERIVSIESETLIALASLSSASGGDSQRLRAAIRAYVSAVVDDEWPRLAEQERSAKADAALNALLQEVALPANAKDPSVQRTMLDMVLKVHMAHEDRIALANDRTVVTKWLAVLGLAFLTQISIAVVHLEKPRPQVAAMAIFTVATVLLLGLLAVHEAPFEPPVFIPPGPIAEVLQKVRP